MAAAPHTLVLLRHAKSDWSGSEPDRLRPLAARGRRQAPEAGGWLNAHLDEIDLAVVSPAARARETWELCTAELDVRPPTRIEERVYAADEGELLDLVRELPVDVGTVVVVGHNPGLEDLATSLTDRWVPMRTSALAVLSVPAPWSMLTGGTARLRAAGRPPVEYPGQ